MKDPEIKSLLCSIVFLSDKFKMNVSLFFHLECRMIYRLITEYYKVAFSQVQFSRGKLPKKDRKTHHYGRFTLNKRIIKCRNQCLESEIFSHLYTQPLCTFLLSSRKDNVSWRNLAPFRPCLITVVCKTLYYPFVPKGIRRVPFQ